VAAILVEPIQGEGGVVVAPREFLVGLRKLADQHGAFLIADEIQTGVGRTGSFLAFEQFGVQPDVVALAKGLGGGFPIGAMLCKSKLAEALPPGSHGTTFGGNPLASRVALTVLEVLEREGIVKHVAECGRLLNEMLQGLAQKYPKAITAVRGLGLLQAVELAPHLDARNWVANLRDRGVLVTVAGGKALRLSPPLIITDAELREGVGVLASALEQLQ
jgi:acetylornithine/N-succinyldiaminopimelate aminotransferase